VLVTLVEAWERKHNPMDLQTQEALKYRMDQNGLQPRGARTPLKKISKELKRTEGSLRQKARALGIGLGHQR